MTTTAVGPVGAFGNLIGTVTRVGVGTVTGPIAGVYNGSLNPSIISSTGQLSEEFLKSTAIGENAGYGKTVFNFLNRHIANFVGGGIFEIKNSGLSTALGEAYAGNAGTLGKVGEAFTGANAMGLRGLGMLGLHVAGSVFSIISGVKHMISSLKKFSDSSKGYRTDVVDSPTVHLLDAACGLTQMVGGIMMLFPPTAALGVGASIAGLVGTLGMSAVKYAGWGGHWFNYPNTAPIGLSNILQSVKNPGLEAH